MQLKAQQQQHKNQVLHYKKKKYTQILQLYTRKQRKKLLTSKIPQVCKDVQKEPPAPTANP